VLFYTGLYEGAHCVSSGYFVKYRPMLFANALIFLLSFLNC